jgi:transposase
MKRRIPLETHLTSAQIKARFLKCEDLVERSHWQTLGLLSRSDKNYTCTEVADLMGFTADWVRKLVRRYNADPVNGLLDERSKNGKTPVLNDQQKESLQRALETAPPDHGLWSGPKVAHWMSQKLNQPVSAVTGWHYLTRLGWSLQISVLNTSFLLLFSVQLEGAIENLSKRTERLDLGSGFEEHG